MIEQIKLLIGIAGNQYDFIVITFSLMICFITVYYILALITVPFNFIGLFDNLRRK